jgi:hypothetical protein
VAVPLLISEKEILAVGRVDAAPVGVGFFHGGDGRMFVPGVLDAEFTQACGDGGFLVGHAGVRDYRGNWPEREGLTQV